jgi:signal transduction histidine kinase
MSDAMSDATSLAASPAADGTRTRSIRHRLTRRLLVEIVTFAIVSNALLFLYLQEELIEQYDDALSTEARAVATLLESEAIENSEADLSMLIANSFPRLHLKSQEAGYLQVWRTDGTLALKSPSLVQTSFDKPNNSRGIGRIRTYAIQLPDGDGGRAAIMEIGGPKDSKAHGWTMLLAEPTIELDKTLLHLAISLVLIAGGMCAFAVYLVVNGVRRELLPLDTFAEAVGAVRAETLGFRFDEKSVPEELVPIAGRMNDLLGRIGEAFDRERRFSGNLAHELRTPIAEMRTMLEVASRWPPDAQGIATLHNDLLAVAVRTSSLLEALLTMVRHQQGRRPIVVEPTGLRACVEEAWETQKRTARERGVQLSVDVPVDLFVAANHAVLVALLSNLLENAASYTAPGSTVSCRATTSEDHVSLTIENPTTELQAEDLPRLHEPFWRKDAARVDRSHAGLGLALVREYAAAMHLELSLSMPEPCRLAVRLTWPQSPAAH